MSDTFPTKDGLKQGDTLSLSLSNFTLECAPVKIQANKEGTKINGPYYLLVYAGDVNLLGKESIHTIKKNTGALLITSKKTNLGANNKQTMYSIRLCLVNRTGNTVTTKR